MNGVTLILDILLAVLAVSMLVRGYYGATRQLGLAPLIVAALDAAFSANIQFSLTPVISVILLLLQVVILAGGAMVLYQDRVRARNKQLRRERRRALEASRAAFEQAAAQREHLHEQHRQKARICA